MTKRKDPARRAFPTQEEIIGYAEEEISKWLDEFETTERDLAETLYKLFRSYL